MVWQSVACSSSSGVVNVGGGMTGFLRPKAASHDGQQPARSGQWTTYWHAGSDFLFSAYTDLKT